MVQETTFADKYILQGPIGHPGSYGQVHAAESRETKQSLAVKVMQKPSEFLSKRGRTRALMLANEARIMRTLRHPNIIDVVDVFETRTDVHIVMERCDGGDLFDRVVKCGGRIPEAIAAPIFRDLLLTVLEVHRQGIVHGDLKLSNIMFKDTSDSSIRLIDFGMSQFLSDGAMLHEMIGTPNYQSPDVITGSYNVKADCWSLGIILFAMVFGFNPFDPFCSDEPTRDVQRRVLNGFTAKAGNGYGAFFPETMPVSFDITHLIGRLLTSNPHNRMSVEEALQHPWILKHTIKSMSDHAPCA
jgi:calcium-dependent protein kinase